MQQSCAYVEAAEQQESHAATIIPREQVGWEYVRARVSKFEDLGVALFESERYQVFVTRGPTERVEGVAYPTTKYHVVQKDSGNSWTVPRLGRCIESLVYLADAEWRDCLQATIENVLQELAEEFSEVTGGEIRAWCKSRPDVVQVFTKAILGKKVLFPMTLGTRELFEY